jgi:uncharacterized protein YjiS (DUF1127 family)
MYARTDSTAWIDPARSISKQDARNVLSIAPWLSWARSAAVAASELLCEWRRRSRSRRELQSLSRQEIADFCPGFTEAEQEARKPFRRA